MEAQTDYVCISAFFPNLWGLFCLLFFLFFPFTVAAIFTIWYPTTCGKSTGGIRITFIFFQVIKCLSLEAWTFCSWKSNLESLGI